MWLPRSIEDAFAFFSDAGNLDALTPPWLDFRILTPRPIVMQAGTRIDYRLRVHLIPIRWQSEITVWQPPRQFVDEQRRGPYQLWHHRHDFAADAGGTWIRDHVEYQPRGWICAPLINRWLVAPDLRAIFAHRHRRIRELLAPHSISTQDKITLA
jgi:ligand-binding SRPBCC domain-containing protein